MVNLIYLDKYLVVSIFVFHVVYAVLIFTKILQED